MKVFVLMKNFCYEENIVAVYSSNELAMKSKLFYEANAAKFTSTYWIEEFELDSDKIS